VTDFGKRNAAAPTGFFACEAAGVRWLEPPTPFAGPIGNLVRLGLGRPR
jgi:hypothetical protein